MTGTEVTAIIPVFNDRPALEIALKTSLETLSGITGSFEILVAEDGSTDGSTEFVRHFEAMNSRVRLLHHDERQGRGRALNRAIRESRGTIVCYYDVDLATDMKHLPALISAVRDGSDISTGSRLLPASDIVRTGGREIASRSYNFLVRLLLGSRIHDHQCGFKAFNRDRVLLLLPAVQADHWFWDTEILVRAQRAGYRVTELPVRWRAGKGTTVKFRDVFEMGTAVLYLWWRIHVSED
ncbi:MAG: glycosyltransferase family 2 protein [Methanoregula sp.]|nr:glycosyltransferase family 2 protein [Methanoregula sp.]